MHDASGRESGCQLFPALEAKSAVFDDACINRAAQLIEAREARHAAV